MEGRPTLSRLSALRPVVTAATPTPAHPEVTPGPSLEVPDPRTSPA